jgi:hypothetical protein
MQVRRDLESTESGRRDLRDAEHKQYLEDRRELNDKIYGTPEMRRQDAERRADEDAYTHEPES